MGERIKLESLIYIDGGKDQTGKFDLHFDHNGKFTKMGILLISAFLRSKKVR
jgi:hypothetical protein